MPVEDSFTKGGGAFPEFLLKRFAYIRRIMKAIPRTNGVNWFVTEQRVAEIFPDCIQTAPANIRGNRQLPLRETSMQLPQGNKECLGYCGGVEIFVVQVGIYI